MVKYIRTYHNGLFVVAELQEGDHKFVMNEKNLLIRIRNGEAAGIRMNVEKKALKFIRAHAKYDPSKH